MAEDSSVVDSWSPEEWLEKEKKLVRKIDFRLLPILVSGHPSFRSNDLCVYLHSLTV